MLCILDFGSQYTQLIARRLRGQGFSTEVLSGRLRASEVLTRRPGGIILSGSPASVGSPFDPDPELLSAGVPVLGLCFGYQYIASRLGGRVESSAHREYGAAQIEKTPAGRTDPLTARLSPRTQAWMSHGDSVVELPPGAVLLLRSADKPAGFSIPAKRLWGLQFHPEVYHTPEGKIILEAFARDICKLTPDWNLRQELDDVQRRLQEDLRGVPEFGGELPIATFVEDLLAGLDTPDAPPVEPTKAALSPIRALLTIAGNPVLSSPGGAALGDALERLDFVVCVDMYLNETTRHADLILPPCSPLERSHYDVALASFAVRNVAKWSAPMLQPGPDARADWQIIHGLATRIARLRGASLEQRTTHAAMQRLGPDGLIDLGLRLGPHGDLRGRKLGLAKLRAHPHGLDLGPLEPCLPQRLPRRRITLVPEPLLDDLGRLERACPAWPITPRLPGVERPEFTLISRRQLRSNNSWMHNLPKLMAGKPRCTLEMHPSDAELLALRPGDRVRVSSSQGAIEVPLALSEGIMRGVVCLPHGFGHGQQDVRMQVASAPDNAGASINDLVDPARIDELSGVAALTGERVRIELVA